MRHRKSSFNRAATVLMRRLPRLKVYWYLVCSPLVIMFAIVVILLAISVSYAQMESTQNPASATTRDANGQSVYLPFLAGEVSGARNNETNADEHHHDHTGDEHGDAHDHPQTAREHFLMDFVVMDAATEEQLAQAMVPGHGLRSEQVEAATDAGVMGSWSAVQAWPIVAVHTHLLPNGKILAYDSVSDNATGSEPVHNTTRAVIWDPATGGITRVDVDTGYNIFCSGHAHLPNGMMFIAGGNLNSNLDGLDKTHTFNPQDNHWTMEATMLGGRWYPSVTPLGNGEMLITAGGPDIPEVRKTDGTLRILTGAELAVSDYPWMQTAPDGTVAYFGPDRTMLTLNTSDTGAWHSHGHRDPADRSAGSYAMYDVGKILISGGGGGGALDDAMIVDINGQTPQVTATGNMVYRRKHHNLTILADGTVLATGGISSNAFIDLENGVYAAEIWDPATGQWTELASNQVTRQYHSTAILLPDGRVLTAGGGLCAPCQEVGYLIKSAEVYSPPYLFKKDGSGQLAARPTINLAPDAITYGQSFTVNTPEAASIQKVGLLRVSSVTHSVNMEQRYLPLSFSQASGALQVTAPANVNIAPPGYYMLFIVNSDGVPSVAKIQHLQADTPPPTPTPTPLDDAIFADNFESGDFSAWSSAQIDNGDLTVSTAAALIGSHGLEVLLDDNRNVFVLDERPNAEPSYRARFYFDPNSISMTNGDAHFIFYGHAGTSSNVFRIEFRFANNSYQMRAALRNDSTIWINSNWFVLNDGPHSIEIDWKAASGVGTNDGYLTFWLDEVQRANLTGVDNDTLRIDRVQLGAVLGVDTGTNGTYYFDAFVSRRHSYIGPDTTLPTATPTNTPTPTPTDTPTPTNTPTPTDTSTPEPSEDLIFADDFEGGDLSAWSASTTDGGDLSVSSAAALWNANGLQALINDNTSIYVTDDRPDDEPRYRARFYFDPNSISMAIGDMHALFYGYSNGTAVLRLNLRFSNNKYQLQAGLLTDGATARYSSWFTISDAPHAIEVDWRAATTAGSNDGYLTLWIDGIQRADLTDVDNDMRRIDQVRLGAVTSVDTGTRGTYYFDAFVSRRNSYIGTELVTQSAALYPDELLESDQNNTFLPLIQE